MYGLFNNCAVPQRLFFAAQQRIAITWSPKYYQKMRSITRKNQKKYGPDVKKVGRNYQKTISVVKMSQAKPPFKASPPTSSQVVTANFPHGGGKCASCRHHFHSPDLLARWKGEGGVICELMPFNNESSDWAYIQHEDGQWCFNPLLFRQDLPNSYWRLLASFGEFI